MSGNPQDLSPTLISAQKGILDNKQTLGIRKVTIESIGPCDCKVNWINVEYKNIYHI